MAETRVDLLHLLEDLRDAYPGAIEETILTEILANSLDSGANLIQITADSTAASLTIVDNGSGMPRRDLRRYHDLAATTKTRGQGIGFAGVGIKLALLACKEVVTETRRGKVHVATSWHLTSRQRAPWKWVPPPGLVAERGTAVKLHMADPLSPLADRGFVEAAIRRHYQPLLDPACDEILAPLYPRGTVFEVNGETMRKQAGSASETAPLAIRAGRKRKPSAAGYLFREPASVPEDQRGIAISTYGKIIKRGWDWLGVSPNAPERIGGVIEVPALAAALTLNKGDFIRTGQRGAAYLAFRKAIQEAVVHRRGGQKRLPLAPQVGASSGLGFGPELSSTAPADENAADAAAAAPSLDAPGEKDMSPPPSASELPAAGAALPKPRGERRPIKLGLAVQFEDRPGDLEPGRLVESTVFINRAHPAYQRAAASRSEGYHIALSVALALAPLAVEPTGEHAFVTAFLSRWGEAVSGRTPSRRRRA